MREARDEPWRHLERAYRDPHAAHARLNDLVAAEGWKSAAVRIDAKPEQLGRLLGRAARIAVIRFKAGCGQHQSGDFDPQNAPAEEGGLVLRQVGPLGLCRSAPCLGRRAVLEVRRLD